MKKQNYALCMYKNTNTTYSQQITVFSAAEVQVLNEATSNPQTSNNSE
jgi:hypothetical protein